MMPHLPVHPSDFSDNLQAAIDYAYTIGSYVLLQPKEYHTGTLIIKPQTRIIGYGATLIGSGYINGPTPVPASDDVLGQTFGACFTDNEPATTFSPHFEGFKIQGFRYAFCSVGYAWYHPTFINMSSEAVNIFFFGYQGMQNPRIENVSGTFNCLLAGHATCFSSTHPFRGQDNVFTDGIHITGMGGTRPGVHPNPAFDEWFEQAILRPDEPSTWIAETNTYPLTGTWRKVSGRLVYLPGRNRRMVYSLRIKDVSMETATRGLVCVRAPHHIDIENIGGENIFHSVGESMILTTHGSGVFKNIQINQADSAATAKASIEVIEDPQYAYPYEANFSAINCEGAILGRVGFIQGLAGVSIGSDQPHPSAKLQIDSGSQGFLPPRMSTAQRNSINATNGLIIMNITTGKLNFYFNGTWRAVTSS